MTREEAIKVIKSATVYTPEEMKALETLIPELRESEDERIRKDIIKYLKTVNEVESDCNHSVINEWLAWLEKQKEQNGKVEEYTDFTIYHPLKNGKGEYECIPYSFYGSLTSFSEDKDLIDFLRTCFYTEEECNEWIERQKEQKSRIDACGFPLRDEGESACSYLERCLAPDMRNIWYEACSEIKEKQQEQKLVDDNQIFLKGLMRVRDDKTLTEWEKQFDNIADKYAHNKNKEGYNQSWYTKERAAEMLHFAKKELEQSTECIKTEELPKHIKAEFESFRNLLKKKGIDYQPAETYWTDFARLFVSSAKKLQKPAEWSEEDEDMLNSCISSIEEAKENRYAYKETDGDTSYDHEIAWLKSLRPSWKPSKEQIYSLGTVVKGMGYVSEGSAGYHLKELYEQLKKLM